MRRSAGHYRIWVDFLTLMLTAPRSIQELSDKTGVNYETLRLLIKELHKSDVVHISHWKTDSMGRQSIAVYQLGYGIDALKRKPKTGSQRTTAYEVRKQVRQERPLIFTSDRKISNNTLDAAIRGWS